eukprot:XP_001706641.1 Hypothetical protein GL50803_26840 [Giardia lamblia ATCC 50803]
MGTLVLNGMLLFAPLPHFLPLCSCCSFCPHLSPRLFFLTLPVVLVSLCLQLFHKLCSLCLPRLFSCEMFWGLLMRHSFFFRFKLQLARLTVVVLIFITIFKEVIEFIEYVKVLLFRCQGSWVYLVIATNVVTNLRRGIFRFGQLFPEGHLKLEFFDFIYSTQASYEAGILEYSAASLTLNHMLQVIDICLAFTERCVH